jgi:murein DD-endopeptidase MepM/ murein hydrolase activator NlpD
MMPRRYAAEGSGVKNKCAESVILTVLILLCILRESDMLRGRNIRWLSASVVLLSIAVFVFSGLLAPREIETPPPPPLALSIPEVVVAPGMTINGMVRRNATLASSLQDSVSPATVHALVEAARPIYDLARVSVGHPFGLTLDTNGLLTAFTYGIDELRTLHVIREGPAFKARLDTRTYDVDVETFAGAIESSLFAAIEASGAEDQLALDMAEVFSWDVDFNTEVQRGDSFRVAVETMSLDGRRLRYGKILAAEFVNVGRVRKAVFFESASGPGYYAPDGNPLRRAFLRSPLRFSRVSSGFTRRRFHPVLGIFRPHLGVDFAAPTGTPVHSVGDGVVTVAGWLGGYGQTVKIRHPNGYETLYGHLSRILVRRGQRVTQGAPIGRVGSTGLATGPHLDYRMQRGGVFVDPLKVVSPPAEPVRADERPRFEQSTGRVLALLDRASDTDAVQRAATR